MPVLKNVVCPFCGCTCDELEITFENNKIKKIKNACTLSSSKFHNHTNDRILHPFIRSGKVTVDISLEEAIQNVANMLIKAKYPLIYGLSSTSCETQKIAVELAQEVGAVLDNTTTTCHGPTILGIHNVGESTCTLGQVKQRADLIIYWGANPTNSHPMHMARYTLLSKGRFRNGRKDRKLVVIDVRKTHTAKMADYFIQIEPNRDYELLSALRMMVKGESIEQENVAGIPLEKIEELAEILINCEFGIIFFGLGLTMSTGKSHNIEAALSLVQELNTRTKFLIMPMRGHFNVTGANKVSTWRTGYSFATDFSQGHPRYNPGETTAIDLMRKGDCDTALIVASDPLAHWPKQAAINLSRIPLAVIDPKKSLTSLVANLFIPSTMVGIEARGVVYRMDGIPLLLRKLVEAPEGVLSDEELLKMVLIEVKKIKGK